jgi:hypothetical protein
MTRLQELTELLNTEFIAEYAYATSDTATTYGMGRTGCWYVSRKNGNKPRTNASSHGYATKEEAQAYADIMNGGTK